MAELTGEIESITYSDEDNGFTIARIKSDETPLPVTITGKLMSPAPGTCLKMEGDWVTHPKFGRQFKVRHFNIKHPVTETGIKKYLGSGLIDGLGKGMAARIVKKFGLETLNIIENDIEKLLDVEGIGKKRITAIKAAWDHQNDIRDVMIFLQSYGISTTFATKIYKTYGNKSIEIVKENPYCLADDIIGIGFKKADLIASNMGLPKTSPFRIRSGILFGLKKITEEGHVFSPYPELIRYCSELLELTDDQIAVGVGKLFTEKKIILEKLVVSAEETIDAVYPASLFYSEKGVANCIEKLMKGMRPERKTDISGLIQKTEQKNRITLAPKQRAAVLSAFRSKVLIITGGPGTGKTTIIKTIIDIFAARGERILLTAPTGRAAKRMNETTGHPAKTIHRLLEFSFKAGGFQRNEDKPLRCDVLIVDESSMIDIGLMYQLLKAVPESAVLILVGDVNQLPSVGSGNVLNDIICSGTVPVAELTEIFRQAGSSMIVVNAHRINNGNQPKTGDFKAGDDFFFIEKKNPESVVETIVELVKNRIPGRFNYNPLEDIQILTPMHKGIPGSENLNRIFQEQINTGGDYLVKGERKYKINDKVIQIRNNYEKDVFNGDIGKIESIDPENKEVTILFDTRKINYSYPDLDEITLAYAISVHKSQGSEYPVVVIPVTTQHYIMLRRNLIYTGVTRGKELVILVGTKQALMMGIKNNSTSKRYTWLDGRLKQLL